MGFPGSVAHNRSLGRYWSHEGAERIVEDPDASHVWLITRFATFREFTDSAPGDPQGLYETVSPSDEYRKLFKVSGGWELRSLDGTVQSFDSGGLWTQTVDRNGNTTVASYTGVELASISFPDGRSETFTYHPGGKLATITEVGVDGTTTRTWSYMWLGEDLERIDRPDGRAWRFVYSDAAHPGFLTEMRLVGNDATSERIERAWQHDAIGNVIATWKGSPVADGPDDPDAVDVWRFSFDDPALPTVTTVTDPLGMVSTRTLDRDPVSLKPRLTEVSGDCPSCGMGPNAQLFYEDAANPLRVTRQVDGRGHTTIMTYDANGQLTSRTEAMGTPEERTTLWSYEDPNFPSFPTKIDRPSVAGGMSMRTTSFTYGTTGDLEERTHVGVEDGSPFVLTTINGYKASGTPESVDPPGYGTDDVTTWTYDPTRGSGDLVLLTRVDPLIGATAFAHDAFNRRTGTTDPNGVTTTTSYDDLNRITQVVHEGATDPDDLVTINEYTVFGDLFRTTLPKGNVVEYGYDQAGRLTSIERKPDVSTSGERTMYTLDGAGNRIREELQRFVDPAWIVDSFTDFVYDTRCFLDKMVHADGSVTEHAYDCEGNLERVWDANHPSAGQTAPATQVFRYDALDRLKSMTQPWTGTGGGFAVTGYGYDVQDHLTSVTDAEGNTTTYIYSDRDLLTEEVSPVSGTTHFVYNDHGELTEETDARGITVVRTVDALDRVTFVDYPGEDELDTVYTYDEGAFSMGRLSSITRSSGTVSYAYDRFGRLLQDGDLGYGYDKNGNRTELQYPSGVVATTGYDFADRPSTLEVTLNGGGVPQPIVVGASYRSSGPLAELTLGNGLVETRSFDERYHPTRITLEGITTLLDWDYTTDDVGNVTAISDILDPLRDRVYGYQDMHYFLTQGEGPWGTLSWSYDRVGNRLSEARNGGPADVYVYTLNSSSGNTPLLSQITLEAGGTRDYGYDAAGNVVQVTAGANEVLFGISEEGRVSSMSRPVAAAAAISLYDGRGFLTETLSMPFGSIFTDDFESGDVACWSAASPPVAGGVCPPSSQRQAHPVYSSDGVLQELSRHDTAPATSTVLMYGGRPVAQVDDDSGGSTLRFLTTDHLGTPILLADGGGGAVWDGGFEPFGEDYQAGSGDGASESGVFLRLPGQWEHEAWRNATLGADLYYNVHRWYEPAIGRYSRPDPLGIVDRDLLSFNPGPYGQGEERSLYNYALQNPLVKLDPLGLMARTCCKPIAGGVLKPFKHCYIEMIDDDTGERETHALHRIEGGIFGRGTGRYIPNAFFDRQAPTGDCGPWNESCGVDDCVRQESRSYPSPSGYHYLGPNSNTFANTVTNSCNLTPPGVADTWQTPGWNSALPSPK